jgi:hypothetical protein
MWRGRLGPPKTRKSRARIQLASELVEALVHLREASGFNAPEDFFSVEMMDRRLILTISEKRYSSPRWTEQDSGVSQTFADRNYC